MCDVNDDRIRRVHEPGSGWCLWGAPKEEDREGLLIKLKQFCQFWTLCPQVLGRIMLKGDNITLIQARDGWTAQQATLFVFKPKKILCGQFFFAKESRQLLYLFQNFV